MDLGHSLHYLEEGLRNTLISMLSCESVHGCYTSIILSRKKKSLPVHFISFPSTSLFFDGHYLTFSLYHVYEGMCNVGDLLKLIRLPPLARISEREIKMTRSIHMDTSISSLHIYFPANSVMSFCL